MIRSSRRPKPRRGVLVNQGFPFLEQLEDRCLLSSASAAAAYGQLPLAFQPNYGQAPAGIGFVAEGQGYKLLLDPTQAILGLQAPSSATVLSLSLVGANPASTAQALDQLPGVSNYLIGNDPSQWHTNIPNYAEAQYSDVYPGVDLRYYGNQGQLEYDFVVNPGGSSGVIRLAVHGAQSLTLDAQGDLVVHSAGGDVLEKAPVVYQVINGVQRAVAARFVLQNGNQLGFAVGAYDASLPLVIDPVLAYSTYLGGSGTTTTSGTVTENEGDGANGIAVDSYGEAYITGDTYSADFPTTAGALSTSNVELAGTAFVAKLNASGTGLLYSTYLGGTSGVSGRLAPGTQANAIAVNGTGDAYITGVTGDSDFPTAGNPVQPTIMNGGAYVAELNPTGTGLIYSSFFGRNGTTGISVALDPAGDFYIAGDISLPSNGSPGGSVPVTPGSVGSTASAAGGFVAKFNPSGSQLSYCTLLPAPGVVVSSFRSVNVHGLAVDASGAAYVAADAVTADASGGGGPIVDKLSPSGTALIYAADQSLLNSVSILGVMYSATAIAVNSAGDAYVCGLADGPYGSAMVDEINAQGTALIYSIGPFGGVPPNPFPVPNQPHPYYGLHNTEPLAIAVDSIGDAFVAGGTNAANYPTLPGALQTKLLGAANAVLTEIRWNHVIVYSTYLGGSAFDFAQGVAVDNVGNVYVAGVAGSSNFPTTASTFQRYNNDPERLLSNGAYYGSNAFVAKIGFGGQPPPPPTWVGTDIAGATDDSTRLLWTAPGESAVWPVSSTGSVGSGSVYGPFSGWSAVADATGSDGNTRILWTNTSGAAALWIVNASGVVQQTAVYGPFSGWSATDVAVGKDGNTRILWTNTNGAATVWDVYGPSLSVLPGPIFNPGGGWTASKLTTGSDGLTRLLWTNPDGASAVYTLFASGALDTVGLFGAMAGWTPVAIAVGSDDQLRILWDNASGAVAIWDVNSSYAVTGANVYGPFAGWVGSALAAEPDGTLRLLWDNSNGAVSLWDLTASGGFVSASVFGPILLYPILL